VKGLPHVFNLSEELRVLSSGWRPQTDTFSTFPVQFGEPEPVREGMLQVGDAAGFIDPFVGDGISMALHSGVMAATAIQLANAADIYAREYRERLSPAYRYASRFRKMIFTDGFVREAALTVARLPGLLPWMLRATRARAA
jgi:flavin-dependent dehydrogenase